MKLPGDFSILLLPLSSQRLPSRPHQPTSRGTRDVYLNTEWKDIVYTEFPLSRMRELKAGAVKFFTQEIQNDLQDFRFPFYFTLVVARLTAGNIKKCYQTKCHIENYLSI
jgi:hypothetical protein